MAVQCMACTCELLILPPPALLIGVADLDKSALHNLTFFHACMNRGLWPLRTLHTL